MVKSVFVYAILGVLLVSVQCDLITVCVEDDEDLRVDCHITPKPSQINSYEFSWANGTKESVINTNVSGSRAEAQFKDRSYVEELDPQGYRMTLTGFTQKLPHNTTYMCKISKMVTSINIERENLAECSAVSVFLKTSCSWILCLLLYFCCTHS
uniref:Ig-like domain-containing protein n=1 Tax=Myripristis murdjan TaxID=586833 RepID=A0A667Y1Y0_9TELE